jgi:tetratricopeptide (TPR) repeat protein
MTCRDRIALVALGGLAAALLGVGRARADDAAGDAERIDRRLAERLTRLAERHYRAGEYYRAISAYEELALFTGDDATRLYAAVRIAMSYHHGRQLDDALGAYRAAIAMASAPTLADGDTAQALRIQLAVARVERGLDAPGSEALDAIAAELGPSTTAGRYRQLALYQVARIEALAGRGDAARKAATELRAACLPAAPGLSLFQGQPRDIIFRASLAPLVLARQSSARAPFRPHPGCGAEPRLLAALGRPPVTRRSPWLGVALSMVVPGAGSVYGGRLVDGLYGFALTTLSGLGALDVYDGSRGWGDQKVAFYGLAALAAIFYAGGAVQGYVSVARHNAITELDARHALWRDTDLPLPLEDTGGGAAR